MLTMLTLLFFLLPWAYVGWKIFREEQRTSRRALVYLAALANLALVVAYVGFVVGFWFGTNAVKY